VLTPLLLLLLLLQEASSWGCQARGGCCSPCVLLLQLLQLLQLLLLQLLLPCWASPADTRWQQRLPRVPAAATAAAAPAQDTMSAHTGSDQCLCCTKARLTQMCALVGGKASNPGSSSTEPAGTLS
jgi:hypothetical protein